MAEGSTVWVKISGLETAVKQLQAAVIAGAQNGLRAAAVRGEELVKKLIDQPYEGHQARVNYGILLQSIAYEIQAQAGLVGRAVVFAQPPADVYSGVIEMGRRPGRKMPPINAILLWLESPKMQGLVESFISEGHPTARNRGADYVERRKRQLAFLIGRKVAAHGIPAHMMFSRAAEQLVGELKDIIEGALVTEIEKRGLAPGAGA